MDSSWNHRRAAATTRSLTFSSAILRKIKDFSALLSSTGHDNVEIQVDGNVSFLNIAAVVAPGASMLVRGTSSIFHKDYSIGEVITTMREIVKGMEAAQ